jgi:hypothetical protein
MAWIAPILKIRRNPGLDEPRQRLSNGILDCRRIALKTFTYRVTAIKHGSQGEYRSFVSIALAKGSEKAAFLTTDGTRSLFARCKSETEMGRL